MRNIFLELVFVQGQYTPCVYWNEARCLPYFVHDDDYVGLGAREEKEVSGRVAADEAAAVAVDGEACCRSLGSTPALPGRWPAVALRADFRDIGIPAEVQRRGGGGGVFHARLHPRRRS